MDVWVDNVVFTSCQFKGDNKIHTLTNFALAQLNPGTHTIKVVLYKNLDSADFDLQGYNINAGNRTTLSLVFFEQ